MEFLKKIFCFPFTKIYSKNENLFKENNKNEVNKINIVNTNDEQNNSDNETDLDPYKQAILNQEYGLCPECNQPNTYENWCKECYSKKFQQDFGNWTSGNERIDMFIQESQLNARNNFELLEWIPYNRLRNIQFLAQGGFSTVYKAIWLDGWIQHWDYEKQDWKRYVYERDGQEYKDANNPKIKNPLQINEKYGYSVVLKSLNDSSNINNDFLNEWKLHLQCQHEARSNITSLIPLLGITQDPDTLNYMIVMNEAYDGSLRNNLKIKNYNPNDKFLNLWWLSTQLESLHKLNLVHGDFHNGNILYDDYKYPVISDLGLCRPVSQHNVKNDVYGVLPYIAPEVLR
ncbi:kinase-like domain-containing protein, partial [Glomus cerebriforme]